MLSLDQIRSHLIYKFNSNQELIQAIQTLWQNFTADRKNLGDYLKDERLVSAYTAFYLLSNYQKLKTLFEYAKINPDDLEDYKVFDIGCGPGTFLVAFSELVFGHDEKLFGIELSEIMRRQATTLLKGLGLKNISIQEKIEANTAGKKLAIFGHSINEMKNAKAVKYVEKIDPDLVFVIEPGTKESFDELLLFRQNMLKQGYHCLYPCPSNAQCPMQLTDDWCHQYMKVQLDQEIAAIAQSLHLDRGLQAISCFIFAKDPHFIKRAEHRMVRYYRQTKHCYDWQICQQLDEHNQLQDLEVTKKGLSKNQVKEVQEVFPGQEVQFTVVKELPEKLRVQLKL